MRSRCLTIFLFCWCLSWAGFAQTSSSPKPSTSTTQLDHFDPKSVDSSIDPCNDFYKYACNRWIAANPVPPDEFFWGSFGKLVKWNNEAVHQTVLDIATQPATERSPVDQKVGDYWSACIDQKQRNATALDTRRPQLQRIESMISKDQIAAILAELHRSIPGVARPASAATFAPLFGFSAQPDFHNTQRVIPQFDQGGSRSPAAISI